MTDQGSKRPHLHAIILAAGSASRFGSPKQLATFSGETLLARAAGTANALCAHHFCAVIGANRLLLTPELIRTKAPFTINEHWETGLGSSIAAGIKALPTRTDGALFWHADQPLLTAESLGRLVKKWADEPEQVVASVYREAIGVPVIFPRRLFAELAQLSPLNGAKKLIENDRQVVTVRLPEAATDIDTTADLSALVRDHDQP
ncbi:MAG: nucleotidyltransferase family protein [Woeseiaceae bacterium]